MSRRRGAFSAFEKTASQVEASRLDAPQARSIRRSEKTFSVEEAKVLLESLRAASTKPDFQKALANLRGREWGAFKKREAVARLLAVAWKVSLKAAGFSIDQWGFPAMLAAVRVHHGQPGIRTLSEEIERQLRFQPGDLFGSKAGAMKQTGSAAEAAAVSEVEVQVTVTHPTDRDSVVVTVPPSSTMRRVKEALAEKLGRPEVTRNGRMVMESQSGDLLPVPESQRLGGKRQIFMVGISFSQAPSPVAKEPPAGPGVGPPPKAARDRPLNLGEAKELLKAFREIASSKDFQRTLGNIHKQGPEAVQKMQPMFVGQSFNPTMAMYDFPLTNDGYQDLAQGISKHSWNIHVKAQAHEVERLLRTPPGAFFGIPGEPGQEPNYPPLEASQAAPKPQPAKFKSAQSAQNPHQPHLGIEVIARHAVDNAEVRVELPKDATFLDCKRAISKVLGRDEILKKGRLVRKKGGVYSAYKDEHALGATRQVLVLGADLRTDPEPDPMPPIESHREEKEAIAASEKEAFVFKSSRYGPESSSSSSVHRPELPRERQKEAAVPKAPKPKPPQEYEIRIRHAVESGPEVKLKVWTNWTFGMVRDALAKQQGRADIQKRARFAFKAGTGTAPWIAFKDEEVVGWNPDGTRREELMLLGVGLDLDSLGAEKAVNLLEELDKSCAQEELQAALQKLHDRGGVALQLGLTQLVGQAAQKAADSLGMGGLKLQKLIDAVTAHSGNSSVRSLAASVERKLGLGAGRFFGLQQETSASAIKGLLGRNTVEGEMKEDDLEPGLELSAQQAVALQRDLYAGFAQPSFQRRLDDLERLHSKDPKLILLRQELFLSVQSKVLPQHGFRGDLRGVFNMLEAFKNPDFQQSSEFMRLGSELNALLRLAPDGRPRREAAGPVKTAKASAARELDVKPGSKTPTPPTSRPVAVRDIEVVVRHAVQDDHREEEARLTVKGNATMKAVKEALVAHVGKPELLHSCRLVQPVGDNGAFSSFKDSEKLNSRRALLVLGMPSLRPPSESSERKVDAWPAQPTPVPAPTPVLKSARPAAPKLTTFQALSLQRDLLQGFSDADFQAKRQELIRSFKHDPKRLSVERQKLFLTVQKLVLPMYGFEAGPKGVFDMLEQFDRPEFAMNTAFQEQGAALNHLLFVDAEPEADADHSDKPRQKDVEVVIRHAVQEGLRSEEARLFLKSNATMKEVREALAEQLKLPASSCRLVERVGASGAFASFRDSERIQGRRALLVMGVESLKAPEEREMEQREEERQKGKEMENEERSEQERRFAAETPLKRQALALQAPRKVRQLTLQEALALQRDLIQGFSKPEFQARKADLERRLKNDPKNFSLERQALFLTVQRAVLPKYSLEGSARGVFDMMQQFVGGEFDYDPEFQRQGSILTGLLFSEDAAPEAKSSKKAKPSEPVLDVEVVVRHAVEEGHADEEARVTVKSNSTMKQVKDALAAYLDRPELLKAVRVVHPVGDSGAFASYKDSEKLQGRRFLLAIGLDSLSQRKPKAVTKPDAVLSLADCLALQKDLLDGFSDPVFQAKRALLQRTLSSDPRKFSMERQKLFLTVQTKVLPKYGFEGSPTGVFDMMQQFERGEVLRSEDFQRQGWQLNQLLFSEAEPEKGGVQSTHATRARSAALREEEVEVTVKLAVGEESKVKVTVKSSATIQDVQEALAERLGRPEILKSCRLAQRLGDSAAVSAFREEEKIGGQRNFLVLGVDNLEASAQEVSVRVRRAGDEEGEEVTVTVPSAASMYDVRAAVARQCNSPQFLKEGRLVRNQGGVLVGYKDSEAIRGRRRLLFVGPSLRTEDWAGKELTLQSAQKFLERVRDACSSSEFQENLAEATSRRGGSDFGRARMAAGALFIGACRHLLRKFGFSDDRKGYDEMFTAIFPHGKDQAVFRLTRDIEKLLGVAPGSWFGISDNQEEDVPQLGQEEARRLVAEIRRLVAAPAFQREIACLRQRAKDGVDMAQKVYTPLYQLLRATLLSFRLRGDPECIPRMRQALAPHLDAKLRAAVQEVEDLLRVEPGSLLLADTKESKKATPPKVVALRIRHAIAGAEVRLSVPSTATMGQIREALAQAVGDGVRKGRLVESRRGGAFTSFQDQEKLGKRRRLLFLGADLPKATDNKSKLSREAAAQLQLELLEEFRAEDFQTRLKDLQTKFQTRTAFYVERRKLVLSVQTKVIPKYGFPADLGGVFEMVRLLGSFPDEDGELSQRGWEIERLIGEREVAAETDASEVLHVTEAESKDGNVQDIDGAEAHDTLSDFMNALNDLDGEMPDTPLSSLQSPHWEKETARKDQNVEQVAAEIRCADADTAETALAGSQNSEMQDEGLQEEGRPIDAAQQPVDASDEREIIQVTDKVQPAAADAADMAFAGSQNPEMQDDGRQAEEEEPSDTVPQPVDASDDRKIEQAAAEVKAAYANAAAQDEGQEEEREPVDAGQPVNASDHEMRAAVEPAQLKDPVEGSFGNPFDEKEILGDGASMLAEGAQPAVLDESSESQDDEDWDEASRVVDEYASQIQEVLAASRSASKKEKAALLAKKRELERAPEYLDALAYLEDPDGERERRQRADAQVCQVVDEVASQIAEVLASMRTASKKEKTQLLAKKRELEGLPKYLEALQYLEDPVGERLRCRQEASDADENCA